MPKKKDRSKEKRKAKRTAYALKNHPKEQRSFPTSNSKMIHEFMEENHVKGFYKDYVIMMGDRLVDWLGSFNVVKVEEGKFSGILKVEGMALIHKRNLHTIIGDEAAKRFWHPRLGRVGIVKPDNTPKKKSQEKPEEKPEEKADGDNASGRA